MKWSGTLLTINIVLLAALVTLLGLNYWGDRRQPEVQAVDLDATKQLLADVEQKMETSIKQALAKSGEEGRTEVETEKLTSAIVERIDEVVADHEIRLRQVAEEVRVASAGTAVTTLSSAGGGSSAADGSRAEIATFELAGASRAESPPSADQPFRIVHFVFNSAKLTPGGERKTMEAVNTILENQSSKIRIAGFSDTKGDADYNMKLSEQRARTVADQLIRAGVEADRIEVLAFGESELPEPTGDDVDEPLNRCVSITVIP